MDENRGADEEKEVADPASSESCGGGERGGEHDHGRGEDWEREGRGRDRAR